VSRDETRIIYAESVEVILMAMQRLIYQKALPQASRFLDTNPSWKPYRRKDFMLLLRAPPSGPTSVIRVVTRDAFLEALCEDNTS
jgi:hypothetical protein